MPSMLPVGRSSAGNSSSSRRSSAVSGRAAEQVGAALEGAPQRLRPPPAGDPGVVARPQHLGHRPAPEVGGPRVLRVLEQARSPNDSSSRRRRRCPSRPGRAGSTASITTSAAASPPASTKSPTETSPSQRWSATRWSTPSYRPHSSEKPVAAASSRAIAWSKRRPLGRQQQQRARRLARPRPRRRAARASSPCPRQPPNGVSSTLRCGSSVCSRGSCSAHVDAAPRSRARPMQRRARAGRRGTRGRS